MFRARSTCSDVLFRLQDIVSIEVPNWPKKPSGWRDDVAAFVNIRGYVNGGICLDAGQWEQLQIELNKEA